MNWVFEIQVGTRPRIRLSELTNWTINCPARSTSAAVGEIRFEESGERRTAIITVLRPTLSSGKIKEVDAEGKKLVATCQPIPSRRTYRCTSRREPALLNGSSSLADLRPDDRVRSAEDAQDRAPLSLERGAQSLTSFVKGVTPRNDKLWLRRSSAH